MQPAAMTQPNKFAPYLRAGSAVVCGSILTFFATQIYLMHKYTLPMRIGVIATIAIIGIAGIGAILSPEEDEPVASEKLYTADEVAALMAAVPSGRLVAVEAATCKFCGEAKPDVTGVDGSRYHQRCFRAAYVSGKT
jgi:phosphatidylglycerophosphatase A